MNFLEKALQRLWFSCGGHCQAHSDGPMACPLVQGGTDARAGLDPQARYFSSGLALVAACLLVFLLPLATAAGGGFLACKYLAPVGPGWLSLWQLLGVLVGLAVGVACAKLALKGIRPKQIGSDGGKE